jgi:iron(III) transport system substrate-binding protein
MLSAVALAGVLVVAAACTTTGDGRSVTVYSGRSTDLIKPLLDQFAAESGIDVEFKQGDSADLALTIDQEGDRSPADVFISQSPGATAFLDSDGRLSQLPDDVLDLVPADRRAADGTWVGLSGRVRVLAYNPELISEAELPASVLDLSGPEWAGRVAVAPQNGSFQDFVSAMRVEQGDDVTAAWLDGLAAGGAPTYANNNAILQAVARGEVPTGLVNHYYLERAKLEDPGISAANHVFADGDIGSVVLVTAAAVIDTAPHRNEALELVRFLLSPESQEYFATETREYPLIDGVEPAGDLPPLESLATDAVDFSALGDRFRGTLDLIRESGLGD